MCSTNFLCENNIIKLCFCKRRTAFLDFRRFLFDKNVNSLRSFLYRRLSLNYSQNLNIKIFSSDYRWSIVQTCHRLTIKSPEPNRTVTRIFILPECVWQRCKLIHSIWTCRTMCTRKHTLAMRYHRRHLIRSKYCGLIRTQCQRVLFSFNFISSILRHSYRLLFIALFVD